MPALYLRALRKAKGLTQAELAKLSDIKQNTISTLERLAKSPKFETVVALARVLHVDPRDLRFGPEPPPVRRRRAAPVPPDPETPGRP